MLALEQDIRISKTAVMITYVLHDTKICFKIESHLKENFNVFFFYKISKMRTTANIFFSLKTLFGFKFFIFPYFNCVQPVGIKYHCVIPNFMALLSGEFLLKIIIFETTSHVSVYHKNRKMIRVMLLNDFFGKLSISF